MPRPIVALASAAVVFVVLTGLFASWQRGFSEGAQQATDQILAEQDQTAQIIRLRAQLDEQRRAEDRVSNTLLAAFTAGAAILIVVNFASYFVAQQRLQEERGRLQQDLIRDAEDRDRTIDQALRAHVDQRIALVENRQAAADARMDNLASLAGSVSYTAHKASAVLGHELGIRYEDAGEYIVAATFYATAAFYDAKENQKQTTGKFFVSKVVDCLKKAPADESTPGDALESLVENLRAVDAAPPHDAEVSALVQEAVSLVERFQETRDARETQESWINDDIPQ